MRCLFSKQVNSAIRFPQFFPAVKNKRTCVAFSGNKGIQRSVSHNSFQPLKIFTYYKGAHTDKSQKRPTPKCPIRNKTSHRKNILSVGRFVPQEDLPVGCFVPWEVLSYDDLSTGRYVPWDVLSVGRFVCAPLCMLLLAVISFQYILNKFQLQVFFLQAALSLRESYMLKPPRLQQL